MLNQDIKQLLDSLCCEYHEGRQMEENGRAMAKMAGEAIKEILNNEAISEYIYIKDYVDRFSVSIMKRERWYPSPAMLRVIRKDKNSKHVKSKVLVMKRMSLNNKKRYK